MKILKKQKKNPHHHHPRQPQAAHGLQGCFSTAELALWGLENPWISFHGQEKPFRINTDPIFTGSRERRTQRCLMVFHCSRYSRWFPRVRGGWMGGIRRVQGGWVAQPFPHSSMKSSRSCRAASSAQHRATQTSAESSQQQRGRGEAKR